MFPERNGRFPTIGKRDLDSKETEAIRKVTQALATDDYDITDDDIMLKRSLDDGPVTTDMGLPPTRFTTPAEML